MSALVLKLIAAAAMLIDHIAVVAYPFLIGETARQILRSVGRLAFPIFAYFIAVGYRKTSDLPRYLTRLCRVALLSQIPFVLVFVRSGYAPELGTALVQTTPWPLPVVLLLIAFVGAVWLLTVRRDRSVLLPVGALLVGAVNLRVEGIVLLASELNVFYTLALGLACVSILDRAFRPERDVKLLALQAAAVAACFVLIRDTADFRYLGAALIICFWAAADQPLSQLVLLVMWAAIEYLLGGMGVMQFLFAAASSLLLLCYNGERGQGFRRFFYWFYPVHLAVLGVVNLLLSA
ncbi:MAG: conjugal transfer protein TraX [Oscillospiraceae bacterium]|nr:conjugal transfer protein TraX [Oscillospiraceae bacterium]